ncbi:heavy metal translocating P-type ATPase, partial [Parapedobacter sp.]
VGARLLVRNGEIIPADAILLDGTADIDFSFVTGESDPVRKALGEIIYAGGRQLGGAIELKVVKVVSQSYLTQLWNNEAFKPYERKFRTFSNVVSRYFTFALLTVAALAMGYWFFQGNAPKAWGAFTAVLIIGCPCALALSGPFTLSAALGIFDRNHFYVKNTAAIEQLAAIDCLVFDKTGTISSPHAARMHFYGELAPDELAMVAAVAQNSSHPLSRELVNWAGQVAPMGVRGFREVTGKGIEGMVAGHGVRVGSAAFIGIMDATNDVERGSRAYVAIDGEVKGCLVATQPWRPQLAAVIDSLAKGYALNLVSGDHDKDREQLRTLFPRESELLFDRLPIDKLEYIRSWQSRGSAVCMFGDGLNDAGALKQANLGVAVSDDINNFSPGCDAVLDGRSFAMLPRFFAFAKDVRKVIHMSFGISLVYNAVGLGFAVTGTMSPLFAAILMPLSTVTIIGFTTVATRLYATKKQLINDVS